MLARIPWWVIGLGLVAASPGCGGSERGEPAALQPLADSRPSPGPPAAETERTTDGELFDTADADRQRPPEGLPFPVHDDDPVGGVAVIDLNRLAEKLGRMDDFQSAMERRRSELNSDIDLLEEGYRREIEDFRRQIGSEASAELQWELNKRAEQRDQSLFEARRQALIKLTQFEESLKRQFMDEVRAEAYQVAENNGFQVVLTVPQVFAYQVGSEVDITERVFQRIRAFTHSQPAPTLPSLAAPGAAGGGDSDD